MDDNPDVRVGCERYASLLAEVGGRVPGKGSILVFNGMPLHTLRSGTATVADVRALKKNLVCMPNSKKYHETL